MAGNEKNARDEQFCGISDTTVLKGLEAVRKRPGMYTGSTGERGLHRLVHEVADNSVDGALTGYAGHIEVMIQEDDGIKVVDSDRNIPVDERPAEHKPTVEVVMTILHAGGKFGDGGYAVSGGLHGVGVSAVNVLSIRVNTEIRRQGYVWYMSFANGGTPITPFKRSEETDEAGTIQVFYLDPKVFETVEFDFEILRQRFQQMVSLSKGLCIVLTDEREFATDKGDEIAGGEEALDKKTKDHRAVLHCYEHGLHDYIEYLDSAKKSEAINNEIIGFEVESDGGTINMEIAIQWIVAYSPPVYTLASTINATEGGVHEEGLHTALTLLVSRYGREKGIIRDKDNNLTGDDVREGLTTVISIKLTEPQLEDQTKTKLGSTKARTFVAQQVYSRLTGQLDAHPASVKAIINRDQVTQAARVAAREVHEATRRKGVLESVSMPGRLHDCSSRTPSECEIFIVKGDSADGPAVGGRDPERQTILPIHGKTLSVEKARLDRALSPDTIRSLITVFGTGVSEGFDISKLRYGKIVIMADADADGRCIATLLLTLLFRCMRPLTEGGHTFIAVPLLYRIRQTNAEHEFAYPGKGRDELLAAGSAANRRLSKEGGIQRYKGLGEMNDHELRGTTMDLANRILKQVTLDEAVDADETFMILMGDDIDRRRTFIQCNTTDVCFLDI